MENSITLGNYCYHIRYDAAQDLIDLNMIDTRFSVSSSITMKRTSFLLFNKWLKTKDIDKPFNEDNKAYSTYTFRLVAVKIKKILHLLLLSWVPIHNLPDIEEDYYKEINLLHSVSVMMIFSNEETGQIFDYIDQRLLYIDDNFVKPTLSLMRKQNILWKQAALKIHHSNPILLPVLEEMYNANPGGYEINSG